MPIIVIILLILVFSKYDQGAMGHSFGPAHSDEILDVWRLTDFTKESVLFRSLVSERVLLC